MCKVLGKCSHAVISHPHTTQYCTDSASCLMSSLPLPSPSSAAAPASRAIGRERGETVWTAVDSSEDRALGQRTRGRQRAGRRRAAAGAALPQRGLSALVRRRVQL